MLKLLSCLFLLFTSTKSLAKIEQNEQIRLVKESYNFKEVCDFFNERDLLMIEEKDLSHIDCMGKIIDVNEFCQKKELESSSNEDGRKFLRGIIISDIKSVQCERAEQVILKYTCENNSAFCQSAFQGCRELQKIFARGLNVLHSSLLENDKKNELNCLFGSEKANFDLKKELSESI